MRCRHPPGADVEQIAALGIVRGALEPARGNLRCQRNRVGTGHGLPPHDLNLAIAVFADLEITGPYLVRPRRRREQQQYQQHAARQDGHGRCSAFGAVRMTS